MDNMKNTAIIFILLFILTGCGMQKRNPISSAGEIGFLTEACFKDECFSVEIADTIKKRHLGLMYHENLAPQSGMLFIFPTVDKHNFG